MASTHKIAPSSPRMASLLSDVTKGNIKIPVFQREYVWNDEQIMSLLDSIYMGYPVGSLLLWSTKEALNHERNVGGFKLPTTPEDYPVNYVLDGQQRLTTLYGVFHSDSNTVLPDLARRFSVCFVPETGAFVHESVADPESTINLRDILDTTKLLPKLQRFSAADQSSIAILTERFKDYEFPVVTIRDRTNQEVCRVFQRVNSSGTSLGTLELLAAWTWSDQFDLRNEIQGILDRLSDEGYDGLGEAVIMRCLSAIVTEAIETDGLVDEEPTKLVQGMATVRQAIFAAIDFLDTEFAIRNFIFIPFPIMLVPLVYFFSKTLKPTASQRKVLCRWFWDCCFSQRYRAGTNSYVMSDLAFMRLIAAGDTLPNEFTTVVTPEFFKKSWRINSTAAKAAICLLAQHRPLSFFNGARVDLGSTLSAYNARQFHHIYPKSFLGKIGISFHTSNVIANVCLLTASDNNLISDKDPSDYFAQIPAVLREKVLESALIPSEYGDGSQTYTAFLEGRAKALAEAASYLVSNGHFKESQLNPSGPK